MPPNNADDKKKVGLTRSIYNTVYVAVKTSDSLEEVFEKNPYETRTKRDVWERFALNVWKFNRELAGA